jgi:hypothetical protein
VALVIITLDFQAGQAVALEARAILQPVIVVAQEHTAREILVAQLQHQLILLVCVVEAVAVQEVLDLAQLELLAAEQEAQAETVYHLVLAELIQLMVEAVAVAVAMAALLV